MHRHAHRAERGGGAQSRCAGRSAGLRRPPGAWRDLGPLDGIPYTAKDSYLVKGLTAASGSPAFKDLVAQRDAFTVERLRAAGAICLGKTNMPPMANGGMQRGVYGRAESPYNAAYLTAPFASGSSNGAGTATAASFAAFGLAEETWSSGRGPASNNGLCAYTPSRGVISVRGNWPLTPTMDVVVPYARSMADLLEILDVVVADDPDTRGDLWRMQPWVPIPKASEVRPASYPALAAGARPWPASASACRACSSTPTPMRAPASPRDRRPDRPAHPYPALGHRPLGTGAQGPGSRRRRSDRGGLPAGVELRGRPTRRAHRVQPRPGVEGIPPRRAVGTLGLGLRRLPARQWRSEAEPPGGCRRPADLPHDPGTLPNREGDLAAGMDEYVRMAERGIKPWDRIATLPDGLRGLEETRRIDLEEWMRRLRLDAVLFPTVADVGPADADVNPASADIAWSNGVWVANGNLAIRHLGVPTVTVPMGVMADIGMPVGLTFAGRAYDDSALLRFAAAFESTGSRRIVPPRTPPLASK